jgi:hypothetical protein
LAVQTNFNNFQYVRNEFKTEELCKLPICQCNIAVQQNGLVLKYIDYKLQTEEMCKLAVQQNGNALKYVRDDFRTEEMCKLSVQKKDRHLKYVASEYLIYKLTKI